VHRNICPVCFACNHNLFRLLVQVFNSVQTFLRRRGPLNLIRVQRAVSKLYFPVQHTRDVYKKRGIILYTGEALKDSAMHQTDLQLNLIMIAPFRSVSVVKINKINFILIKTTSQNSCLAKQLSIELKSSKRLPTLKSQMRGFDNLLSIGWLIFVDFCPNCIISLKLCNKILWEVKYRLSVTVYLH